MTERKGGRGGRERRQGRERQTESHKQKTYPGPKSGHTI